jgi:hypothetical protein
MMMDNSDLIIQYFGYLITEFGFSVEKDPHAMGNAFAIFKSSQVGIEIVIDRSQVLIALGDPMEARKKWLDYSYVLEYLSPSAVAYLDIAQLFDERRAHHTSNKDTWDEVLEFQLRGLASMLRQYCEPILKGEPGMKQVIKEIKEKDFAEMLKHLNKSSPST